MIWTCDLMHSTTPYHYNIELLMFGDGILFKYIKFSKSYTKYLDAKIILYKNIVNCKVLDLAKHYQFDADLYIKYLNI